MGTAKRTIDHDEIRRWVEARGGTPAHVTRTGGDGDPGVLRIDFPGYSGAGTLESVDWETWLQKFDESQLAFLYQDEDGSRFNKLVRRTDEEEEATPSGVASSSVSGRSRSHTGRWTSRTTRVTINNASREELESLWGVGPAIARRIIAHRQSNGPLRGPEDLRTISGIDGATAQLIAREATFE